MYKSILVLTVLVIFNNVNEIAGVLAMKIPPAELNLPPEPEVTWIVRGGEDEFEDEYDAACLLAAGDISLELFTVDNDTVTVAVPAAEVSVEGGCGEEEAEVKLVWSDEGTGEENLLNLVISRRGRLAALTGAFLRVQAGGKREDGDSVELTARMDFRDLDTPIWPLRYGLNCPHALEFPLYPAPLQYRAPSDEGAPSLSIQPAAVLMVENLRLEVFRQETLLDQYPVELIGDFFTLKTWDCEFHVTFDWAPVIVGGGLASLVVFVTLAFLCKQYNNKNQKKYELM